MIDGHVHTPYCPHGSSDSFRKYIEKALLLGYKSISFTEHAPLPRSFTDPTPLKDSGMNWADVETYIKTIQALKKEFQSEILINVGFEVDYIEGYERETESFLNNYGPEITDSILSVHFLKTNKADFYCLDYSPNVFEILVNQLGSLQNVYEQYYKTYLSAIKAKLGPYKPNRMGHLTLVRKFQKKFPNTLFRENELAWIEIILKELKKRSMALDVNGAGLIKPLCLEPYPSFSIIERARTLGIPLVFGSDAHQASALAQGYEDLKGHFHL